MGFVQSFVLAGLLASAMGAALAAEAPFTLTDDGSAFLYRARPGDSPSTVATMFGIAPEALPVFLRANGIADATRVPAGHVFRIPNPLATRAQDADARAGTLARELADIRARAASLDRELGGAREAAADADRRSESLARYESLWWTAIALDVLLTLALVPAIAIAVKAARNSRRAEHYARSLADELDEKRRRSLGERQEAARRILDLEAEIRELKVKREQQLHASAGARRGSVATR